jgi:hypothetical protein
MGAGALAHSHRHARTRWLARAHHAALAAGGILAGLAFLYLTVVFFNFAWQDMQVLSVWGIRGPQDAATFGTGLLLALIPVAGLGLSALPAWLASRRRTGGGGLILSLTALIVFDLLAAGFALYSPTLPS